MTLQTRTYNYTAAVQTFVVPANVTSVRLELWGAGGGHAQGYGVTTGFTDAAAASSSASGALAMGTLNNGSGYAAGTLAVTPGQTLSIYVGGNGYSSDTDQLSGGSGTVTRRGGPGGYNGGGAGGKGVFNSDIDPTSQEASGGAGGGGATDIRSGGVALANRILVAGGSGGMGGGLLNAWSASLRGANMAQTITGNPNTPIPPYSPITYYASGGGRGGYGGPATGAVGGNAASYSASTNANTGGKGGTASAGGVGGVAAGTVGIAGAAGALGIGGAGAIGTQTSSNDQGDQGGGGGGGGYYGGGGGGLGYDSFGTGQYVGFGGGGGGGSNYVSPSFVAPVTLGHAYPPAAAGAAGNGGFARATYTQPPSPPTIHSPLTGSVMSFNSSITFTYSFSSVDPSAFATAIDVQWKKSTDSVWNLQHVISGDTGSYTFPANFFSPGFLYNVQVRTYDNNNDTSAWVQVNLSIITPPATPVITAPAVDAAVASNTFNVTWTNPSGSPELSYRLIIARRDGSAILYDTGDVSTNTRLNLALTPSFENGTAAWTVVGGAIATSTTWEKFGSQSGKVTWATSSAAYAYTPVVTQPGKMYAVSAWVALGTAGTDPQITVGAANPTDPTTPFESADVTNMTVAGTFVFVTFQFVAQQSTTWIVFTPGSGTVTSGKVTYIDAVLVELNAGITRTYFDGSNANGNTGTLTWTGTTGNSVSKLVNTDVLTHQVVWPSTSVAVTATVRYSTVASSGADSNPASRNFTINVAPPGVPTVVMTTNNDTGSITFTITANDAPAATAFFDIFRTDITHDEDEIRIATNLVPHPTTRQVIFADRTAGTRTTYAYRVRAYSTNLGYAEVT